MSDTAIGLGAGLSGFAQGFASTFLTAQERKWQEKTEQNKTARELLIKGALSSESPGDPNDPSLMKTAEELLGKEHVPMFQQLLQGHRDHVAGEAAKEKEALTRPLAAGEEVSVGGAKGALKTTRKGPPQPKAGKSLADIEAEAGARARGGEAVREPAREKAAAAAAARKEAFATKTEQRRAAREVRAERKQFRSEVRKTAVKLRTDPANRTMWKKLTDWVKGVNPTERLGDALQGIPSEALPPSLQAKQAESGTATGATPQLPAGFKLVTP